jgi:hypothetical protein
MYGSLPSAGVTDHLAESEEHALSLARSILSHLNTPPPPHPAAAAATQPWQQQPGSSSGSSSGGGSGRAGWEEPLFPPDELRGALLLLPLPLPLPL